MSTVITEQRICHNCGRPQDHRIHSESAFLNALDNGCSYTFAQPEKLWDAVLWPAMRAAAEAQGVERSQAFRAVWQQMHR